MRRLLPLVVLAAGCGGYSWFRTVDSFLKKDAKDAVESPGEAVANGVSDAEAARWKDALEKAGAKVEIH